MDQVEQAKRKVEQARALLKIALDELRVAQGVSEFETCGSCDGSGVDKLSELLCQHNGEGEKEQCDRCNGSGSIRKTYPLIVTALKCENGPAIRPSLFNRNTQWVSIRPCDESCKGKTYLGYLLGDIMFGFHITQDNDGTLQVKHGYGNPAIFVPSLGKIVYGMESWWAPIKTPEQLRQITDCDISSVWYVQALNALQSNQPAEHLAQH